MIHKKHIKVFGVLLFIFHLLKLSLEIYKSTIIINRTADASFLSITTLNNLSNMLEGTLVILFFTLVFLFIKRKQPENFKFLIATTVVVCFIFLIVGLSVSIVFLLPIYDLTYSPYSHILLALFIFALNKFYFFLKFHNFIKKPN